MSNLTVILFMLRRHSQVCLAAKFRWMQRPTFRHSPAFYCPVTRFSALAHVDAHVHALVHLPDEELSGSSTSVEL